MNFTMRPRKTGTSTLVPESNTNLSRRPCQAEGVASDGATKAITSYPSSCTRTQADTHNNPHDSGSLSLASTHRSDARGTEGYGPRVTHGWVDTTHPPHTLPVSVSSHDRNKLTVLGGTMESNVTHHHHHIGSIGRPSVRLRCPRTYFGVQMLPTSCDCPCVLMGNCRTTHANVNAQRHETCWHVRNLSVRHQARVSLVHEVTGTLYGSFLSSHYCRHIRIFQSQCPIIHGSRRVSVCPEYAIPLAPTATCFESSRRSTRSPLRSNKKISQNTTKID